MNNFTPRPNLPDTWAEKSHCPICGMIPLWVLHQQAAPDEMNCPRCGTAFQVETAGRHLYLTQTPPGYQEPVGEQWLPAKDIRAYTKAHPWNPAPPTPSHPESPPAPFVEDEIQHDSPAPQSNTQTAQLHPEAIPEFVADELPVVSAELIEKARELHELGNSRYKIRMILMETDKISEDEIDKVLNVAFQDADKKNERQNRTLLIVGGILVVLCICSVIAVSIFRNIASSFSPSLEEGNPQPSTQQAPVSQNNPEEQGSLDLPFLPDAVEQLLPMLAGEPPDLPEPKILQGAPTGNQLYACPMDSAAAVNIFGGTASSWTMTPDPLSWAYFSIIPTTIYIPNGLTGEILYINESGGGTRSAPGPATIQNATVILIMCE